MQRLSIISLIFFVLAAFVVFFSFSSAANESDLGCKDGESPFLVLMYHRVIKSSKGTRYAIPQNVLQGQMRWLKNDGYKSIRLLDAYKALTMDKPLPAKSVLITFDDNYPSDYEIAAPVLESFGFNGVFFLISGKINDQKKKRYQELKKHGHEIGCHSVTHQYLAKKGCRNPAECCGNRNGCSPKQISYELSQSLMDLGELLSEPKAFAWPGNYYNSDSIQQATKAGYMLQFACDKLVRINKRPFGIPGMTESPTEIFRVEIDGRVTDLKLFIEAVQQKRPLVLSKDIFWKYSVPNYRLNCPTH